MPPVPGVSSLHSAHVAVPKSEHMLLLFGRHGHVMPFDCSQGAGELRKQPVFWTENRNDDQNPRFRPFRVSSAILWDIPAPIVSERQG